ncbi:type VI secretion system membrane subunit TssM [Candidatus Marithrix sp. Canyon 246]|uniref:type VI secretion system membrane subunit TssM n=1 Tax=Candidatus Marithrix sp. Canyon 246 TaxID=1827136 RepID=UPI00084A02A1|nr:type VI secretion system membrane subunit TssM [Candidatus Marithrix sp. Canyon 246]
MFKFLQKKWVIFSFIGVFALSLLVWFAGPFLIVSLGDSVNRWLTILPLWLIWLTIVLLLYFRERKKSKEMAEDIVSVADEEIASLQNHFKYALKTLRQASGKKRYGDQYLYELPWYVIIGPPGSGKTTILKNSKLNFPLADEFGPDAIRGVGGTRDCDWWFTDEAILLDTAGRYTTQDSDESVDKQTWQGFLGLLKKYRKRRPINGILIVLSITDIMAPDESTNHIRAIRKRLTELDKQLKVRFPIYVLFTKCDLMAGFMEFFERLTPNERSQVWGMTFPPEQENVVRQFPEEFDQLMTKLNTQLLQRVAEERNLQRRVLVYNFPAQIISLKKGLNEFLQGLFRPTRFQSAPFLRGVYFTSGTQEGSPIDRIMSASVQSFGLESHALPEQHGKGRSYFVNRLFKKVIFPESDIVGLDFRFEKQRLWLQRAAIVGVSAIILLGAYAWWVSYDNNRREISSIAKDVKQYCAERENSCKGKHEKLAKVDFKGVLPALDSLQHADKVYPEEDNIPISMRLGLYQGYQLKPSAHDAYERVLNGVFMRHVAVHIYNQLAEFDQNEELLYQNLKVYLMLTEKHINKLDPELLELWMNYEWENSNNITKDEQIRLASHLKTSLNNIIPIKQTEIADTKLVEKAQTILQKNDRALQIYWQIKQLAKENKLPSFKLNKEVGASVSEVFYKNYNDIPGLFTYEGYCGFFKKEVKRVVKDRLKENWVLGLKQQNLLNKTQTKKLTRDVEELYFDEYIKQWKALVYGMKIISLKDIDSMVRMLDTASIPNSPMRRLLQKLQKNTILVCESVTDKIVDDQALKIGQALGSSTAAAILNRKRRLDQARKKKKDKDIALVVADVFEPVFKLIEGENFKKEAIHPLLEQLGKVRDLLNKPSEEIKRTKRNDAISDLKRLAQRMKLKSPVKEWVNYLIIRSNYLANNIVDHREATVAALLAAEERALARQETEAAREKARKEAEAAAKAAAEAADAREKERQDKLNKLNNQWQSDIVAEYNKLKGYYPLSKQGEDIPLAIFANFFGADGVLDKFFNDNLKAYINKASWRFSDNPLALSRDVLRLFRQVDLIKDAFFQKNSEPSVSFYIKPHYLGGNDVSQFKLLLGEQEFIYAYGKIRETKLKWPTNGAKAEFITGEQSQVAVEKYGEWAWFRMLETLQFVDGNKLSFQSEDGNAVMRCKMRVNSIANPFYLVDSNVLSSFNLPERLN